MVHTHDTVERVTRATLRSLPSGPIDPLSVVKEVRVVHESVHTERLSCLVMVWREHKSSCTRAHETCDGTDTKGKWEVAHITQHATEYREDDPPGAI